MFLPFGVGFGWNFPAMLDYQEALDLDAEISLRFFFGATKDEFPWEFSGPAQKNWHNNFGSLGKPI